MNGRVVRAGSTEPVAHARIVCVPSGSRPRIEPDRSYHGGAVPQAVIVSDVIGRFSVELPAGGWTFQAEGARGEALGTAMIHVLADALSDVTIEATGPAPTVARSGSRRRVRMEERTKAGGVRGRVVRVGDGQPVADATILVRGDSPAPDIAALTDADGRFAFDGLAGGTWSFSASGPRQESGDTSVQLSPGEFAEVIIEVVQPEGDTG